MYKKDFTTKILRKKNKISQKPKANASHENTTPNPPGRRPLIHCAACQNCRLSKRFFGENKETFIKVVYCAKNHWPSNISDYYTLPRRTKKFCPDYDPADVENVDAFLRDLFARLPKERIVYPTTVASPQGKMAKP